MVLTAGGVDMLASAGAEEAAALFEVVALVVEVRRAPAGAVAAAVAGLAAHVVDLTLETRSSKGGMDLGGAGEAVDRRLVALLALGGADSVAVRVAGRASTVAAAAS